VLHGHGIVESALGALPVFPLPNTVMFPGTLLPLHVFEARYRDMTAHVLDGERLMGVVRLRPGFENDYDGRPAVYETASVGRVLAAERLPDGRFNIVLRGLARIAIVHELEARASFRQVRARLLDDTTTKRPDAAGHGYQQLLALCDRLAQSLDSDGDGLRQLVREAGSPGECADVVTAALVTNPDKRQNLLETLDPADRIELVTDHVSRLLARFGTGGEMLN
jgi:Lon protease-like protein